jgi:hypothetical protein
MYIKGIKSIKMGACGDAGAMGAVLDTVFEDIVKDTCTLDFPKASVSTITPDDKANPIVALLDDSGTEKKLMFSTYKADLASMAKLFGGSVALEKWSAPTEPQLVYQSVELTSKDIDGFHTVVTIPKAAVLAGYTGKYNKTGMAEIAVEFIVITPQDGAGADLSPVQMEKVAAS